MIRPALNGPRTGRDFAWRTLRRAAALCIRQ